MKTLRYAVLAMFWLGLSPTTRGEDMQMWHWWTNEIDLSRKVSLVIHGQFRSVRPMGEFLQGRTGPIVRYYIAPKTALVGGYFYRREPNRQSEGWGDSHRYFGGIEDYKFLEKAGRAPATLLETRFLVERFAGGPEGTLTDYTRFRYRNRLSFREWKVSPLVGYEAFFFTNELWAHRPHGGIRWRASDKVMLDAGYYWDGRQPRAGSQNHLIFTNLLIRFKRTPNPDFPNRPAF
jgi:hypothetical protein